MTSRAALVASPLDFRIADGSILLAPKLAVVFRDADILIAGSASTIGASHILLRFPTLP